MISRRTAIIIGLIYENIFRPVSTFYKDKFYDFLYVRNYDVWLLEHSKTLRNLSREIQELIMKLHTGQSLFAATQGWNWKQRTDLGQKYLFKLSKDILIYTEDNEVFSNVLKIKKQLISNLELDGYIYKNRNLISTENTVINTEEETNIVKVLYTELKLENQETAFHHLDLIEEHYINKKWDDSISNSRKLLECLLSEVVVTHSLIKKNKRVAK